MSKRHDNHPLPFKPDTPLTRAMMKAARKAEEERKRWPISATIMVRCLYRRICKDGRCGRTLVVQPGASDRRLGSERENRENERPGP